MKQTVDRILEGKFEYERGALELSVQRIDLSLRPNEVYTGSFTVSAGSGRLTEGNVYSDDLRLELITDSFSGTMQEIGYTYNTCGLEDGDVLQGEIYIISNQGEYYLPYAVSVRHENLESSLGGIRNLFHFTNLAKSNWDEAVRLFYSDNFIKLFAGNDRQYRRAYLGLQKYYGNEQNVEEFLLEINKKNPVEYIPEQTSVNITNPETTVQECINITRNGWGYTWLSVETDSDFITLSKQELTENDFLGNYLSYSFTVSPEALHEGANFGTITFFNPYTSFSVTVQAVQQSGDKSELSKHFELNNLYYDMMTYYEAFRTRKITADTWVAETERIVDEMANLDDNAPAPKLFKAQLLMTKDRYNEARWLLDKVAEGMESEADNGPVVWAYYLYLTTFYNRDDKYIDRIAEEVENLLRRYPSEWRIAWLLLYLSAEFAVSPSQKWLFIEEQIHIGCSSPMMYVEAANLLIADAKMLTRLGNFELRVMRYMVRNDLVTDELSEQFIYLAGRLKETDDVVLEVLYKLYERRETVECVRVIAEMLIKGNRKGPEYLNWYLRAISLELRVTELYEYYMESVDITLDADIPKMVLMYFSYENSLGWERTAYLYAKVLLKREEMPEIFESYHDRIREFAVDEIMLKHMNRDLAVIYKFVLGEILITDETAQRLADLIFMHRISISDKKLTKVILYQDHEIMETSYPIENGVAYVPIFNKNFTLLFEDSFSNRYMKSVDYDLEKLMVPGKIAAMILPMVTENLNFDIYACECSSAMVEINEENKARYRHILDSFETEDEYKTEIRTKIMQYYYDADEIRPLDELLLSLEPDSMDHRERAKAISFMIVRGMYEKAFNWILRFGMEGIEPKDIVKLVSKLIDRNEAEGNRELLRIAAATFFKGKYDETIIRYLADNYHGMTKNMRKIFNAAVGFNVDIHNMYENLLLQMLYTGYFVPERLNIYKKYVEGGADSRLRMAFLEQSSFEYFIKDQLTDAYIFEELTRAVQRGEELLTVGKLAYLKYYAETREPLDETVRNNARAFLKEMLEQNIFMPFFKDYFEKNEPLADRFSDKTIVEYKTEPGRRVFIHYVIESDTSTESEYVTEEMPDMFGGIHVKPFILFFGENLMYYITEVTDTEELLTESGNIQKSDLAGGIKQSSFSEINDIVIAKTLQDYDTAESLIYEFSKRSFAVKELFELQ